MARITNDQIKNYSRGGGSFFSLKDGESANVRFLYNNYNDVEAFVVHEFAKNQNYATIDCARQEGDPIDVCKWCASGNRPVVRIVIAIYNEDTGEIQYWKRSGSFVENTLKPYFDEIPANQPISGQVYKLKRTGKDMKDTTYTPIPVSINDGKTKDQFGEIKDPFEINIIRPSDYDYNPDTQPANNQNGQNMQQSAPAATRRTLDMF